jgi:trimethylamine--corrinoid protein Co-methyltransferase
MVIKVLDEAQILTFKAMTETLIEQTGFRVSSAEILGRAEKAGALVDRKKQIVRLPARLLHKLLQKAPARYTVRGCDGSTYCIGDGQPSVTAIVVDPWIIDSRTREPRRPCLADVLTNTILAQRYDIVSCVSRMDYPVTDDDGPWSSQRALLLHLLNHARHNMAYVSSEQDLDLWLQIGAALALGKPLSASGLLSFAVAIRSPLTLSALNCRILLEATARRLPVIPTICPMAGTTAPYDVASTLLLANAECVFLAALTQLLQPGNPFIYLVGPSVSNMHTGGDQYYTQEKVLWKVAAVEMARAYNLPAGAECGGTMDWRIDLQGGAESMLFMQTALGSGADLLTGIGSCFNANGLASETIVIQHAFLEAARYVQSGLSTRNLQEGLADIMAAGHDGHFLTDDLTLKQLHEQAFFANHLFDYSGENTVSGRMSGSMWSRASRHVAQMTQNYVSPVPDKIQEALRVLFHNRFGF